jgi:hypothetical protein
MSNLSRSRLLFSVWPPSGPCSSRAGQSWFAPSQPVSGCMERHEEPRPPATSRCLLMGGSTIPGCLFTRSACLDKAGREARPGSLARFGQRRKWSTALTRVSPGEESGRVPELNLRLSPRPKLKPGLKCGDDRLPRRKRAPGVRPVGVRPLRSWSGPHHRSTLRCPDPPSHCQR